MSASFPRSSPVAALGVLLALLAISSLARNRTPREAPTLPVAAPARAGPLDLNEASAAELERLPRIGPALAARIVEDRRERGRFETVDALDRVAGIGPAVLAAVRDHLVVTRSARPPAAEPLLLHDPAR